MGLPNVSRQTHPHDQEGVIPRKKVPKFLKASRLHTLKAGTLAVPICTKYSLCSRARPDSWISGFCYHFGLQWKGLCSMVRSLPSKRRKQHSKERINDGPALRWGDTHVRRQFRTGGLDVLRRAVAAHIGIRNAVQPDRHDLRRGWPEHVRVTRPARPVAATFR